MRKTFFYNVKELAVFIIRRDWIKYLIWIFGISIFSTVVANVYQGMYPDQAGRDAMALLMDNPAMTAMFGIGYGLDNYHLGAIMSHTMLLMTGAIVGSMAILLVVKQTRTEEEDGRLELIRSLPVGRNAQLAAVGIVMIIVFTIFSIIQGLMLGALGIESMNMGDSMLYAVSLGLIGLMFAAITMFISQIYTSARTVMGISFLYLGFAYLIRGFGDLSWNPISWLSPFHWMLFTKVYVDNLLWPLILLVVVAFVIGIVSMYLSSIRDLDGGFVKQKKGKSIFPKYIKNPLTFAIRIERPMMIGWFITLFVLAASYGSIFGDIEAYVADNEIFQQLLPAIEGVTLTEQFIGMIMVVLVMTSAIPAISSINRLASEERKNRVEIFISHPVKKIKLILSYVSVALMVSLISLFVSALGLYLAASSVVETQISFGLFFNAAIIYLPAIFVMVGISVVLVGFFPTKTFINWIYLGFSFFVIYLGQLLDMPSFIKKLTPFGYIAKLPVESVEILPLLLLMLVSIVFVYIGSRKYVLRDLQG